VASTPQHELLEPQQHEPPPLVPPQQDSLDQQLLQSAPSHAALRSDAVPPLLQAAQLVGHAAAKLSALPNTGCSEGEQEAKLKAASAEIESLAAAKSLQEEEPAEAAAAQQKCLGESPAVEAKSLLETAALAQL